MDLHTPVTELKGVGKTLEKRLSALRIETLSNLLFHFPFRYEDYSHTAKIASLEDGQQVSVEGMIEAIGSRRARRRNTYITEAVVSDASAQLRVVWFGQPYISKTLKVGDSVLLSGKVKHDMLGAQLVSPKYEKIKKQEEDLSEKKFAKITPIYPLTLGMTQVQMGKLVAQAMDVVDNINEWLPEEIRDQADVMELAEAIRSIHQPTSPDEVLHAQRRLKFDELFILQLRGEMIRQSLKASTAPAITFAEQEVKAFVSSLPFLLTKDQKVAAWKILQDISTDTPMNRLLEGDVGSGKTVVAALVSYNATLAGYQVAVMAPTDILAQQHYASFQKVLPSARIALMTGSKIEANGMTFQYKSKAKRKEELIATLQEGAVDIVIGTHALLTDDVSFSSLGLVVVDEQHRFGVKQRKLLKEKSGDPDTIPHFLSMTATPIPRSFALTLYGDLDISVIKEKPAGRKPIKTRYVSPQYRAKAYGFINEQVTKGRQVFVVCPLIEVGEDSATTSMDGGKKTVMEEYEKLSNEVYPDLRVGYLHGKLKAKDKSATMNAFSRGEIDVLVSTAVIEVGVDVPNATVMMIEGAERFGLAQLHQFRGRVGRSDHQSYCFVFSDSKSDSARKRLEFFESCNDGFELAEFDLQERGPGEVYGTNQSGMMNLTIASMQDTELITLARDMARGIDFTKYDTLIERVSAWETTVHLE